MKTLFVSLNSRFSHTLLAPRYLASNAQGVEILESNVNIDLDTVMTQILGKNPDIVAISCYIFNISFVRKLLPLIKEKLPNCIVILGGYEVSFDTERYLPFCDYILKGEGDFEFGKLIQSIAQNQKIYPKVIECGTVQNLDSIVSPYTKEYCSMGKNRILYMETSRGCPFNCSYCMSANTSSVRAFSLPRVFSDLDKIMVYAPKQVKMVDRTFNFNIKRATQIFEYIIKNFADKGTNFHFEMAPQLFDEQLFAVLKTAPKGLIQLEIGVQSYNQNTLKAIDRIANNEVVDKNIKTLCDFGNMHIHTDLIAGLPLEDYQSFISGFNRLFSLGVSCLQLGFLKVLKGSKIYESAKDYQINDAPPYEIKSSRHMTEQELMQLKIAEDALELYHNSGRFVTVMSIIRSNVTNFYSFFYELGCFLIDNYQSKQKMSAHSQSDCLYNFCCQKLFVDREDTFLNQIAWAINTDFALSGNVRKWKRYLPQS